MDFPLWDILVGFGACTEITLIFLSPFLFIGVIVGIIRLIKGLFSGDDDI